MKFSSDVNRYINGYLFGFVLLFFFFLVYRSLTKIGLNTLAII